MEDRQQTLSDADLTALLAERREETLAELSNRYARTADKLSLGIVDEAGVANRVVDATLRAIWSEGRPTGTSLEAAAALVALVHRKSVEQVLSPGEIESGPVPMNESRLPPSRAWTELEREPVRGALAQLPRDERELVVLAYYAGLTVTDVNEGLAVSTGMLASRIDVGLSRLAGALAHAGEEQRRGRVFAALAPPAARAEDATRQAPAPLVILVCDAEPVHRDLVRASLGRDHCTVFELDDCRRLLPSVAALAPDLLVLDPYAPGVEAIDELSALRLNPDYARMPIVVLTTGVTGRHRQAALAAGADDFLAKPFSPRTLAATVARLLPTWQDAGRHDRSMEAATGHVECLPGSVGDDSAD